MSSNTQSSHEAERHERNQARGLKAAITNPNVSAEAKQNAQERLDEMGYYYAEQDNSPSHATRKSGAASSDAGRNDDLDEIDEQVRQGKTERNVIGGYKAVLKNPKVSQEAKEHAEQVLEDHDAL